MGAAECDAPAIVERGSVGGAVCGVMLRAICIPDCVSSDYRAMQFAERTIPAESMPEVSIGVLLDTHLGPLVAPLIEIVPAPPTEQKG